MYSITNLCCICLQRKINLRQLSNKSEDINYYSRLILLFPEMISTALYNQGTICLECCNKVDDFYNFRKQCVRNSEIYLSYTSQPTNFKEQNELLKNCDQSEHQCSSTDILSGCDKTHCGTNETSEKNDNNSAVETDRQENGMNITDETGCDTHPDNTRNTDVIKKEIDIKTEYEETDEYETKTGLEHSAEWENEGVDPLETYGTSSTEDMAQYNYNTTTMVKEEINIKSEYVDVGDHEESAAGQDTDNEISSSDSDENCESKTIKKITQTKKRSKECNICNKTFTKASYLIEHARIHSGEKPFKCDQCNKAFTRLSHVNAHKRFHSGEKPFKCDHCNKAFTLSSDLTRHKRIHSGETPFKCDQCDKAFSRLSSLLTHKRIHSGEKPFKCNQCNKAFAQIPNLSRHKRIHSGERPYECDHCDKTFTNSSGLKRHKRIHF